MTYRERREARIDRLRDWADKRRTKSAAAFQGARSIMDGIPLGQPILVGHHSEKRHRRDVEKIENGIAKGFEHQRTAADMESRADGIERQLSDSIYNDDHDAIERLRAKLDELESTREKWKRQNAAFRKGDEAFASEMGVTLDAAARLRAKINDGYSWCRQPHPSYELQNLGGNIKRTRDRLAALEAAKTSKGAPVVAQGETATARAGLTITATQTTPRKAWKKPRPVWNVSGNLAFWRPILCDELGGTLYAGAVSFFEDPTEDIERACAARETATAAPPELDAAAGPATPHPKVPHGLCPTCGHYGDDCTGQAVRAL